MSSSVFSRARNVQVAEWRTAPMIRESVSDVQAGNGSKWPAVEQRKQQPIQPVVHLEILIEEEQVIFNRTARNQRIGKCVTNPESARLIFRRVEEMRDKS